MRQLFLVFVVLIWGALNAYVARRLFGKPSLTVARSGASIERASLTLYWALFLVGVSGLFWGRLSGGEPNLVFAWVAYLWLAFVFLLVCFFFVRDLLLVAASVSAKSMNKPISESRREFLVNASRAVVVALSGGVVAAGVKEVFTPPEIVRVSVPITNLPESLEGYTIAQVSDIHVGPTIKGEFVRDLVRRVNTLGADLIAVTGDLVDGSVERLAKHTQGFAGFDAADGVYFCTGNHEYYSGVEEWVEELRGLGWTPLLNEHRVLDKGGAKLLVAGCTDYSQQDSDPAGAIAGAATHDVSILLAHQPKSIHAAADAGYTLQLSGHTHGGQFFPPSLFVGFFHPFSVGLGRQNDTWIYVNRGTGYWGPPVRTGVPAEITVLTLTSADA